MLYIGGCCVHSMTVILSLTNPLHSTHTDVCMNVTEGCGMATTGAALTLGHQMGLNVMIVQTQIRHRLNAQWSDMFSYPQVPLGPFPGGTFQEKDARCTIHEARHGPELFELLSNAWER